MYCTSPTARSQMWESLVWCLDVYNVFIAGVCVFTFMYLIMSLSVCVSCVYVSYVCVCVCVLRQ